MKAVSLRGIAVSPGLAIGQAQVIDMQDAAPHDPPLRASDPAKEVARFREALASAERKLHQVKQSVERQSGERDAMIFQAQLAILRDASAQERVLGAIQNEKLAAEDAVRKLLREFEAKFRGLDGAGIDWSAEVRDPWAVVLQVLQQKDAQEFLSESQPRVLVTEELTPSIAMYLERGKVLGIVSERGGKYSHGGILARSFGVPTVAGVEKATRRISSGMKVVVNGDDGAVVLDPDEVQIAHSRKQQKRRGERSAALAARAGEPAVTRDGKRVLAQANIETFRDFDAFDLSTADGVGLLRTEFLFRERRELPSEEEQVAIYREALTRMQGREVTFRTLDVGGDKPLSTIQTPAESNPVLGWRGLRISLQWRDLLIVQLRALLRASAFGQARILLPMVTSVEEVREVRALLDELAADLRKAKQAIAKRIPLGIMVEVPSSAYLLGHLRREIDFVSIGTNDLTQYLLAVDRDNPWVAPLFEPFHPAMLAVLDLVAREAQKAKLEVSVCGEMAGDPQGALLLLSLGIRKLSMAPNFLPATKALLRQADTRKLAALRKRLLACASAEQTKEILHRESERLWTAFGKEAKP